MKEDGEMENREERERGGERILIMRKIVDDTSQKDENERVLHFQGNNSFRKEKIVREGEKVIITLPCP